MECQIKGCRNQTAAISRLCFECDCKAWHAVNNDAGER